MMKKLIQNIAYLFLLLASMTACTDENEKSPSYESGSIVLGLNYKVLSRAETEPGDDAYNENTISKADIFFYKEGNLADCVFYPESVTLNAGEGTVTVKVPQDQLGLFEGTGKYTVYVIANGNFSRNELTGKSVDELRALSFETDFSVGAPSSFVMDGIATGITLTKDGVSGTVDLDRAASKIVLDLTVSPKVESEDGTEYVPLTENMTVSLYNGVKKTNVDTGRMPYAVTEKDYFYTTGRTIKEKSALQENEKSGHVPFYSYATSWTEDDPYETYLLLVVPWKVTSASGDSYALYYYRVPINQQYRKLERNHLYRINLTVAVLGSTQEDKPVELNPNYLILDWGTEKIDTELKDFKYLVLDENKASIYNTDTYTVGYSSSSKIDLERTKATIKMSYPTYDKTGVRTIKDGTKWSGTSQDLMRVVNVSDGAEDSDGKRKSILTITHPVPTNFVPWTITMTVYNKDGFQENLTIEQYPPIYITVKISNGRIYVNDKKYNESNITYGTIIDPVDIHNDDGTNNINRGLHTITATDLGNDFSYMIGDPRSAETNNLGLTGKDYMKTYHPTRTDAETSNMIAPSFMMATSYGKSTTVTYDVAQKRCATYSENGYPAGRWRIPTKAEIQFCIDLQKRSGVISELYLRGSRYWTAHKYYSYSVDNTREEPETQTSKQGIRCVYDVWYWGTKPDKFIPSYSGPYDNERDQSYNQD